VTRDNPNLIDLDLLCSEEENYLQKSNFNPINLIEEQEDEDD